MRKTWMLLALLGAAGLFAGTARAGDDKGKKEEKPAVAAEKKEAAAEKKEAAVEKKEGEKGAAEEVIVFDKAKLGAVKFPHKMHGEALGCAACHEGKEPLFKQEKGGGFKMADMYAGKTCGACHDGKKTTKDGKAIFAAKGGCMKCHKK